MTKEAIRDKELQDKYLRKNKIRYFVGYYEVTEEEYHKRNKTIMNNLAMSGKSEDNPAKQFL